MEKIASWLRAEGFTINYQARGRNWIAFSGEAAQIQRTFHTEIHGYTIDGEKHFANATNVSIPTALAAVVTGIRGLHDFRLRPSLVKGKSVRRSGMHPDYTSGGQHYVAPDDLATIYDFSRVQYLSAGQTIVIVGQTDFHTADIGEFRSSFGLPIQPIQSRPCAIGSLCMMLFGPDPGITADVDEAELDLELSGSVAPNATIDYVNSTDVFSSVQYAIDSALGPVISMSYGGCEQENLGLLAFGESLAQEANSLGITWLASSGDSGAAGCDSPTESQAVWGLAVNFPASIPEVTAVGGTEFNEGTGAYWSSSNRADGGSALTFIPEVPWNDSYYGLYKGFNLAAGGSGISIYYDSPAWQEGYGFPNTGFRDVPDVSFSASADHDGYLLCVAQCPTNYSVYGGTSASTPVFAGIVALLNQYLVNAGDQAHSGLGNINPNLYALYNYGPNAFHDVTGGNNFVPCLSGTLDCNSKIGYTAQPGYDLATGLGSIDAYNLITSWSVPAPAQLKVYKSHTVNFTQGQNLVAYSVGVSNSGWGATIGTVTITENVPAGLTLVDMSGSGWICNANICTNDTVLASGGTYPGIIVTVNVDRNAPSRVTNQVSVSGGNSAASTASDLTAILPIVANAEMSKSTPASGSACTAPSSAGGFMPADSQAALWFQLNWANVNDSLTASWYAPNGSLYATYSWTPVATPGAQCFWDAMNIAGNPPASQPGAWSVAVTLNGSSLFTLQFTIAAVVPYDFNHDGHSDVIWEDPGVGWAQVWYLGGSQGASLTGAANLTQANPWNIAGVGDFDGDGNPDVVWQDPVSGAVQVWFLGGSGGVTLLSAANITTKNPWRVVSVGDFNHDGHPDLLWQDPVSGWAQIWYLGGSQGLTLLGAANLTKSNPWHIVGTADFNNDGFRDVLWQDPVSGTVQIWYMGGTTPGAEGSVLQSAVNLTAGMGTKVVAIADFNGDGHPDVIFQSPYYGGATVYFYTGFQGTTPKGTAVLSSGNPWYIAGPR
jgi:hypothetical protein